MFLTCKSFHKDETFTDQNYSVPTTTPFPLTGWDGGPSC